MANKTEQRKGFSFLRSYYDVLDDIPSDTEKLEYLMAILNRQFKGIEPTFVGVWSKALYKSQRHAIEKSADGWESKTGQQLYQPTQDPSVGPSLSRPLPTRRRTRARTSGSKRRSASTSASTRTN